MSCNLETWRKWTPTILKSDFTTSILYRRTSSHPSSTKSNPPRSLPTDRTVEFFLYVTLISGHQYTEPQAHQDRNVSEMKLLLLKASTTLRQTSQENLHIHNNFHNSEKIRLVKRIQETKDLQHLKHLKYPKWSINTYSSENSTFICHGLSSSTRHETQR